MLWGVVFGLLERLCVRARVGWVSSIGLTWRVKVLYGGVPLRGWKSRRSPGLKG